MASPVLPKNYEDKIKNFENNIRYMYVDSEGNVTVGLGHNLTAHKDYKTLYFTTTARFERYPVIGGDKGIAIANNKMPYRKATQQEIQNDYDFLINHKGLGKYAVEQGTMKKYTTLELGQVVIDALFNEDINKAIAGVKNIFGDKAFDGYPAPCRAALIDLQFNTGNVLRKFPRLVDAVKGQAAYVGKLESERWSGAASQSKRGQVDAKRNEQIRQWFEEGAAEAKKAKR